MTLPAQKKLSVKTNRLGEACKEASMKKAMLPNKRQVKGKLDRAVGRTKRQVEEWTDDAKGQFEDAAHQVKGKAEDAWDKMKHAARDAKDKVTGRT